MLFPPDDADPLAPFHFPQAPVLAPPQPAGGALSSARVAPLPPSFVPVNAWLERLFWLQGGQDGRGGLRHMNERAHAYSQEAQRYVALARAISGVAELLRDHPQSTAATRSGYGAVASAAGELTNELGRRLPALAPVSVTHPAFYSQWRADAWNLQAHIDDPDAWSHIRTFTSDASIPAAQRLEIFGYVRQAVGLATEDLCNSPRQRDTVNRIRDALVESSPGRAWPEFVGATTLITNGLGRMAGPDTVAIVFLKAVATYDVMASARLPPGSINQTWHRLVRWLSGFTGPTPINEQGFIDAVEAWRDASLRNRGSLQAASARVDAYCENFKDRFNLGPGLSALSTVLSCIQLIAALSAAPEESLAHAISDVTPGLLATSTGVVISINRALTNAAGEATRIGLRFPQVQTWARTWAEWIETGGGARPISCAFGVASIVSGGFLLVSGREQHDHWMIAIGEVQIASGLLIVIGLMGVPGLQPLGAVLGFVAAAMALYDTAIRETSERVCRRLAMALRDAQSGWDQANLTTTIGVGSQIDGLLSAIGDASFRRIGAISAGDRTAIIDRLVDLGVPGDDAGDMVIVDVRSQVT